MKTGNRSEKMSSRISSPQAELFAAGALTADPLGEGFWEDMRAHGKITQAKLSHRLEDTRRDAWLEAASVAEAARLHTSSSWGAGSALLRCPTDRVLTIADPSSLPRGRL